MDILPDLPKSLNKREAKWSSTVFRKWLGEYPIVPGPIEIKYVTTGSLLFSAVLDHQLAALLAASSKKGFIYKIPDLGQRNPFDFIYYRNSAAWIVIKYPKGFVIISADLFVHESKHSKRRSLTWERAKEIATYEG